MAMIAERCGMYFSAMNTSSVYISSPECKSHQSCMYTGIATACAAGSKKQEGYYCELQVTDCLTNHMW